jgi:hypothetical protein
MLIGTLPRRELFTSNFSKDGFGRHGLKSIFGMFGRWPLNVG